MVVDKTVSAWLRAETLLARATIALKVDPAQAAIEAKLKQAMAALLEPTLSAMLADLDSYPVTPGAFVAPLTTLTLDMASAIEDILALAGVEEIKALLGDKTFTIDQYSPKVRELLKVKAFEASQRTIDAIVGDVNASLTESFEAGLGIDDAAGKLKDVFDGLKTFELERIARTEINSSQNTIASQTIVELNIPYNQWIATDDDRTREEHAEMDGQIVRTGDPFQYGMTYPGDFGSGVDVSLLINCRCRVRPFIMPTGYIAPPGEPWFYEDDLVPIG